MNLARKVFGDKAKRRKKGNHGDRHKESFLICYGNIAPGGRYLTFGVVVCGIIIITIHVVNCLCEDITLGW